MKITAALLTLPLLASMPSWAQTKPADHSAHAMPAPAAKADAGDLADGEVTKLDKAAGTLTLKHGPLKALNMGPMTMMFVAKDKAQLDGLKVGDKVKFRPLNEAGKMSAAEIRVVK